jgi:hypothetical protein
MFQKPAYCQIELYLDLKIERLNLCHCVSVFKCRLPAAGSWLLYTRKVPTRTTFSAIFSSQARNPEPLNPIGPSMHEVTS